MKRKLTERQRAFVDAFFGPAKGNATKAAKLAGFSAHTARQQGTRLLSNVAIQRAIVKRRERREFVTDFNAAARDKFLAEVAQENRTRDPKVAVRAVDLLNKCEGRYSSTLNVGLTLQDAISQVNRDIEASRAK